jgi:hypothetical protein
VPWPKWFLTLPGQDHGAYLSPGRPDFDRVLAAVTDFLRWTLHLDRVARGRLPL